MNDLLKRRTVRVIATTTATTTALTVSSACMSNRRRARRGRRGGGGGRTLRRRRRRATAGHPGQAHECRLVWRKREVDVSAGHAKVGVRLHVTHGILRGGTRIPREQRGEVEAGLGGGVIGTVEDEDGDVSVGEIARPLVAAAALWCGNANGGDGPLILVDRTWHEWR